MTTETETKKPGYTLQSGSFVHAPGLWSGFTDRGAVLYAKSGDFPNYVHSIDVIASGWGIPHNVVAAAAFGHIDVTINEEAGTVVIEHGDVPADFHWLDPLQLSSESLLDVARENDEKAVALDTLADWVFRNETSHDGYYDETEQFFRDVKDYIEPHYPEFEGEDE